MADLSSGRWLKRSIFQTRGTMTSKLRNPNFKLRRNPKLQTSKVDRASNAKTHFRACGPPGALLAIYRGWSWKLLCSLKLGIWSSVFFVASQAFAFQEKPTVVDLPGHRPDGSVLLPNQWSLRPAGRQISLGDFPVNIAVHPGGRFAAILHSGYSEHQIIVVDLQAGGTMSRTRLKETFYGIEFSKDGKHLFCSGAGDEVVHEYDFENGVLSNHKSIPLRPASETGVPAGLAVDGHGEFLYAANVWGHRVTQVTLGPETRALDIPLGT